MYWFFILDESKTIFKILFEICIPCHTFPGILLSVNVWTLFTENKEVVYKCQIATVYNLEKTVIKKNDCVVFKVHWDILNVLFEISKEQNQNMPSGNTFFQGMSYYENGVYLRGSYICICFFVCFENHKLLSSAFFPRFLLLLQFSRLHRFTYLSQAALLLMSWLGMTFGSLHLITGSGTTSTPFVFLTADPPLSSLSGVVECSIFTCCPLIQITIQFHIYASESS